MPEVRLLTFFELPWSAGLVLAAAGILLLVFGSRWRDFSLILSTSFLAGAAALLALPALPGHPAWPAVTVCLAAGCLTILFRRAAVVILCAAVVAAALALAAHLLGGRPAAQYAIAALSNKRLLTVIPGPDIHSPLLLGLAGAGVVGGAIFALVRPACAQRLTMALVGGLALVAGLCLITSEFFSRPLPPDYPMNYCQVGVAVWFAMAALGVLAPPLADNSNPAADRSTETEKESP